GAGDGDGIARCAPVPSMTAEQACRAVCGTARMFRLCLRALLPRDADHRGDRRPDAVTLFVGSAARGALDAYAATAAAKRAMQYSGALPADERTAHEWCMAGYDLAVRFMGRVADDLASCEAAARLKDDVAGSLSGMDACRRRLFVYPASPLYGRNLADRNKTMLVGLLSNLVPKPPES
ncbi:uncharacterized protein LOC121055136, partial [Oryza brachyantha]|uniref:uncharacterized protein LOC121055136 n=1 Tax=Oryza brachyantha TaxID=4533 RepID=UPI001ADBEACC